jgi:hypothetical protein
MSINTKMRFTILASALALAAGAPAAFAQGAGTTYQGIHTDPGGTADAPAGRHTQAVMQKKFAPNDPARPAMQPPWVPPY